MDSILSHLQFWQQRQPQARLFTFLDAAGQEEQSYTYQSFGDCTRRVAGALQEQLGLEHGDRALLIYPPGLETIVAFFACLRLGVIPVPVYAPPANSAAAGFGKLDFVARDCQAKAALSTSAWWSQCPTDGEATPPGNGFSQLPRFATDLAPADAPLLEQDRPHPIMFLQYTSGSTGDPKGVTVTHANIEHNCRATYDHPPTGVCWLPQYHDMGLIGHYLFMVISGGANYGFSPFDFLRRPALWLQTISRVQATVTAGPNFAFEYCLREDKVPEESLAGLDLSSMRIWLNAAEPVRAETMRRFLDRFAPYGLSPEVFVAGYGLAENTVAVSMHGRRIVAVNKQRLQERRLQIESTRERNNNQVEIVSCGRPLSDIQVRVVDPETHADLGDGRIGEVWVAGQSKCGGYWQRPELNSKTFEARIAGQPDNAPTYLRTGDLGFLHEGEVYICGRVKDLIIIRGVNYYPQDIEAILEAAVPQVGAAVPGRTAAFSIDVEGEERLVVLIEARNRQGAPEPAAIIEAIRSAYFIEPYTIALVPPRTISKTTSGKIARAATRERWLRGELPVLYRHVNEDLASKPASGLAGMLERIRQVYRLSGREHQTVAEIGMDSLTMVDLVLAIQSHFQEHGASSLVDSVDAGFLQDQSIGSLFSLIETSEGRLDDFSVKRKIKALQEQHTAGELSRMRSDAALDYWDFPAAPVLTRRAETQPTRVERLLLTGPTGFFGPFLLASLLEQTRSQIAVLVRATDAAEGQRRITAALQRSLLWSPERESQLRDRLQVICGDLAQPRLGLEERTWQSLTDQTQAILHNGAEVNYVHSYEAMRTQNVGGTRELLRLAMSGAPKAFHLISSTFIHGWSVKPILWETDANVEMAGLDFGYSQTKWVAEALVWRAAAAGLPTCIYRPSLISPSLAGAGSRSDIAIRLLAFMIKYRIAVAAQNQVSFVPADVAAQNIISILQSCLANGRALHVTADEYHNFGDVTGAISKQYGYTFDYCTTAEFTEAMNRLCTKEDVLYPLRPFLTRARPKIEAMEHKRYESSQYREARLIGKGGRVDPPFEETVSAIVEFMLREGLIPAPPKPDARGGQLPLPPSHVAGGPLVQLS